MGGFEWIAAALVSGTVATIIALVFTSDAKSTAARAKAEADEAHRRLAWAERRIAWTEWYIGELHRRLDRPQPPEAAPAPADPSLPTPAPAPADPTVPTPASTPVPVPVPVPVPALPLPLPLPSPAPPAPFDWECLIGVRRPAWLGGGALFIAGALFLHYSIQQNLIAPPVRVALGLVAGAGALVLGDMLRTKADRAGQAISGAGVAILYASIFAARSLYHLVPTSAAFAAMACVTVVAGLMAAKRDAPMLAILGLLGGFLTPYLLSTGEDRPLALFGYVALLDAGLAVLASRKRWPLLGLLGLLGTSAIFVGWSVTFLDATKLPYALLAAGALTALFAFTEWDRPASGAQPGALARTTGALALVAPLVLALVVSGSDRLAVPPWVLAADLVCLFAGAWLAGRKAEGFSLVPLVATLSTAALAVRAGADVFPEARGATLTTFAIPPLLIFALWLVRRSDGARDAGALRAAAVIALVGCLGTIGHVSAVEPSEAPILALFLFAAVHAGPLVAIGALDGAGAFVALGQLVTTLTLAILAVRFEDARLLEFLPAIALPALTFWALPFAGARFRRDTAGWLSSVAALLVGFPFLYGMAKPTWGVGPLGALAVACGALSLASLRLAQRHLVAQAAAGSPARGAMLRATFGGVTLLFVTTAVPILLGNEWLTVAWALEAAALAWLRRSVPHRGLLYASLLLGGATFVRLLANPAVWEYHARSGVPVFNWYLYTFGVPAIALLVAARLFARDEEARAMKLVGMFSLASGVLFFMLLNVEIADFFSTGESLTFNFSGGGLPQDMTYSLAWGLFALGLLAIGIVRKSRAPRIGALVVLSATFAKVSLHDLWALGSLYRVGSILGLAVALLAVSFLTQRFILKGEPS